MSQNKHNRTQAGAANDGTDAPRPENAHGLAGQQQGGISPVPDDSVGSSAGNHGGNHGNDRQNSESAGGSGSASDNARGSSHRGDEANAESNNTGGGADKERKNQTKNTTADKSDYADGNAAPSSANDGGKMGDADNPV